jgi:hypothetical protein
MLTETVAALSSGAQFFRGDLHVHAYGGSHDVRDATATPEAIVAAAKREGLSLLAITDHNEISSVAAAVEAGCREGLLVIPGVELSTPEGHLLCYAPTPDLLDAELIVALKATADKATVTTRGSIDNSDTAREACNILEGSREAFDRRAAVYGVALPR